MIPDNSPDQLRRLWQTQSSESISMSAGQLRHAAQRLARTIFWRNLREYVGAAIVVVGYGYYFYHFHTLLLRLGSALTIGAAVWVAYQLHRNGSPAAMPAAMEAATCLEFHRTELVRQRDLLSTIWKWYLLPFVPGLAVFLLGLVQAALVKAGPGAHPARIALGFCMTAALCAGVFILVAKLNHWAAGKLQRRIDALESLRQPPG